MHLPRHAFLVCVFECVRVYRLNWNLEIEQTSRQPLMLPCNGLLPFLQPPTTITRYSLSQTCRYNSLSTTASEKRTLEGQEDLCSSCQDSWLCFFFNSRLRKAYYDSVTFIVPRQPQQLNLAFYNSSYFFIGVALSNFLCGDFPKPYV